MSSRKSISVIGAGLMGHGIAQVFLMKDFDVAIYDPIEQVRDSVRSKVTEICTALGQSTDAVENLQVCTTLADAVKASEFVFEAAPEKLPLKQKLFVEIEEAASPNAILASNTSVIPINEISSLLKENTRKRVIGTHWWNPPYLVPVVEVIRTNDLSEDVFLETMNLLTEAGKLPVEVKKDVHGFVGNRLQLALWREAFFLVENGICDAATADLVIKNTFGLRLPVLGPFENADLIGLDLTLDICNVIFPHLADTKTPPSILKSMVEKGQLGMKVQQGFKDWTESSSRETKQRLLDHLVKITSKS